MLSNYRLQKYGHVYVATDHNYVRNSTIFTQVPLTGRSQNRLERELMSFMSRSACLFLHKHNIIVRWRNVQHEVDRYYEYMSTALHYKSRGTDDNRIPIEDISLSICSEEKPMQLFRYFREKQYRIMNISAGLFYIYKDGQIDTQVVITSPVQEPAWAWVDYILPVPRLARQGISV